MVKKPTLKKPSKKVVKKSTSKETGDGAVYLLLDRSGSMASQWSEVVPAINGYVDALTGDPDISLSVFDGGAGYQQLRSGVRKAKWGKPLADVQPGGTTALFDAIGKIVAAAMAADVKRSTLVIMTDGEENSSREINRDTAKALLDKCRDRGWEVIFLGANFDAMPQAATLGATLDKTLNIKPQSLRVTMRGLASYTSLYASGASASISFTDHDRATAGNFRTKS